MCAMTDESPASCPAPRAPGLPSSPVPSPCLGICKFNDGGYCKTCFRSTIEKLRWPVLGESARAQVVDACATRRARWHPAKPEALP